jgi:hypothetical protein
MRAKLIQHHLSQHCSLRASANAFGVSEKTVRKWLKRAQAAGFPQRLDDRSSVPLRQSVEVQQLGIILLVRKRSHLPKNVRFSFNETKMIRVGEDDGPAVWNLSAEMVDLLLEVFLFCLH